MPSEFSAQTTNGRHCVQSLAHGLCATAGFALLYSLLFADSLWKGHWILCGGDDVNIHIPYFFSPKPLWNPYLYGGYPSVGDPQSMTWYLPAIVARWLGSWNLLAIAGFTIASVTMYGLVWTLTQCRVAAAVAGVIYGLSGFFHSHMGHVNMVHSAAWIPLALLAVENLGRKRAPAWIAVGAFALANVVLAGHPQMVALAGLVSAAYSVMALSQSQRPRTTVFTSIAAMHLLAVGLSTILLLPMFELAHASVRADLDWETFSSDSFPPAQIPMLLFPFLFGGAHDVSTGYFGRSNLTEITGFAGLLSLFWVAVALGCSQERRRVYFWLGTAAVAFVAALGRNTPLYTLLYWTPFLNKFRIPPRYFLILTIAAAVLAGYGVAAVRQASLQIRMRSWRRAAVALAAAAGAALAACAAVLLGGVYDKYLSRNSVALAEALPLRNGSVYWQLLVTAVFLVVSYRWFQNRSRIAAALLLLLTVLDVGVFAVMIEGGTRHGPGWSHVPECPPELVSIRESLHRDGQRLVCLETDGPVANGRPNLSQLWEIPVTHGYNPLILSRHAQMLRTLLLGVDSLDLLQPEDRSLDLFSARYLLVPDRMLESIPELGDAGNGRWKRVQDHPHGVLFENQQCLPRAWIAHRCVRLPPEQILETIVGSMFPDGSRFDPLAVALTETSLPMFENALPETPHSSAVERIDVADASVTVELQCDSAGILVVGDSDYAGWQATIDGVPAEVHRVHYVLRGVVVPPGRHTVHFVYRPRSFLLGSAITGASLLMCGWLSTRRRPSKSSRKA